MPTIADLLKSHGVLDESLDLMPSERFHPCELTVEQIANLAGQALATANDVVRQEILGLLKSVEGQPESHIVVISQKMIQLLNGRHECKNGRHRLCTKSIPDKIETEKKKM